MEVEVQGFVLDHAAKLREIGAGGSSLDAQQGLQGRGRERPVRQAVEFRQDGRRGLPVIAAQHGAGVLYLAEHHPAGDGQGRLRRHRSQVLPAAQFDVLVAHAVGDARNHPP